MPHNQVQILDEARSFAEKALAPSMSEDDIISIRAGHLRVLLDAADPRVDLQVALVEGDLLTLERQRDEVSAMASLWVEGASEFAYTSDKAEEATFMSICNLFTRFSNRLAAVIRTSKRMDDEADLRPTLSVADILPYHPDHNSN